MGDISHLAACISCHAWNADRTMVALCPNTTEIDIYKKTGSGFDKVTTLSEHDQIVTSIDWAPKSNRIVSCSQDRNAYVWTLQGSQWKPVLVILRINRAAIDVKWSPNEDKFAVASGSKCVSVCYFEEDNDWWVSKHIKKHKSSVLSVDWHPNNQHLATGSSDFKCRVFSAFVKGVDTKGPESRPFGELLTEFDAQCGWVHCVSWSPSGKSLCFVAHDSSINFVSDPSNKDSVQRIKLQDLPYRKCAFLNETTVVAAGHDCLPVIYSLSGSTWSEKCKADTKTKANTASKTGTAAAFNMFQTKASKGTDASDETLGTKHQNSISCIYPFRDGSRNATQYSTSGVDGRLVLWKV